MKVKNRLSNLERKFFIVFGRRIVLIYSSNIKPQKSIVLSVKNIKKSKNQILLLYNSYAASADDSDKKDSDDILNILLFNYQ